jgi:hypothetical protein
LPTRRYASAPRIAVRGTAIVAGADEGWVTRLDLRGHGHRAARLFEANVAGLEFVEDKIAALGHGLVVCDEDLHIVDVMEGDFTGLSVTGPALAVWGPGTVRVWDCEANQARIMARGRSMQSLAKTMRLPWKRAPP